MAASEITPFEIARADLNKFKVSGMSPFCGTAKDISCDLMATAHSLLLALDTGWQQSQTDADPVYATLNPAIHEGALRGVSSLVALALYFGEEA